MKFQASQFAFIFAACLMSRTATAAATPGSLDISFGTGGKITTAIGTSLDIGHSVAVQADGRIVVAGTTVGSSSSDIALMRYLADGSLDLTFGTGGKVVTAIGTDSDNGFSVAVQVDGRIVVAGRTWNGTDDDIALVRYLTNGSLDTTFGSGGKVTTAIGTGGDAGLSVAMQADGRIVVVGHTHNGSNNDIALVRYLTNGSLDATFGTGGKVTTAIGNGHDIGYSLAVQADGRIVVAGYTYNDSNSDIALVRYQADGSLDLTFGTGGKVTTAIGTGGDVGYSVAMQSDGRIVVAGSTAGISSPGIVLVRYLTNGSLDPTFGTGGEVTTTIDTGNYNIGHSVAVQPDERIVVAGRTYNGSNFDIALVRYQADGSLDLTFGTGGKVTTAIGTGNDIGYSVAVQADGRIVVAGEASSGVGDIALLRYEGGAPAAPGIVTQPVTQTAVFGQSVSFSLVTTGSGTLNYQWRKDGVSLTGQTNAMLILTNMTIGLVGGYSVVVTSSYGSVTSSTANLTMAPYVLSISGFSPQPRRTPFVLLGTVTGTGPISYQWLRNGASITGATNTTLTLSGELTSASVSYSLVASSAYGTNSSSFAVSIQNGIRRVPANYWPGQPLAVEVQYGPSATSQNHAYTEQLPTTTVSELMPDALNTAGLPVGYHATGRSVRLVATDISNNGVWDPVLGTVKWGPFFDTTPRTLRYTLVPPLGWTNSITLTGALSEDSVTTANLNSGITLSPAHPADNGPATDQFLNLFEVAAYAAAWRNSRAWHVPPMTIDQNFVTSAGAIWKSGEYYRIVGGTAPGTWQSAPVPAGMSVTNYAGTFVTEAAASPLGVAVRTTVPVAGATNGALNMTITVTPAASVGVFLMEEQLPPGWTATNISNGGFLDLNFNKLKWGPLFSSAPTVYSYTAVPPAGATGIHAFNGLAGFDGAIINIAGQSEYSLAAAPIAPYVLVHPTGSTVPSGATASFGVVAGGTAPLTYQWRKNGIAVSGATNATLTLTNVSSSTKGNYDVVIGSPGGSVTSFPATLTVLSVSFNGMMSFGDSLSDTGNSPAPVGQYFNGRFSNGSLWEELLAPKIGVTFDPSLNYAVSGTETSDLAAQVARVGTVSGQLCTISSGGNDFINNLSIGVDDFVWSGIISTAVNNITSAISSLHAKGGRSFLVLNLPDMGQLPATRQNAPALMTYAGQKTAQFNTALANALTTLQGQLAGSSIKVADVYGRVNQILAAPGTFGFTVTSVDALSDGTLADKSFTGPGANYLFWDAIHPTTKGHAQISTAAEVALGIFGSAVTAPAITQQPQAVTAVAGSRVILGVGATGTAPLIYQWRLNGTALASATNATLRLNNVQSTNAGSYDVVVSNAAGSATSSAAVLSIQIPPPMITAHPTNRIAVAGNTATFAASATSSGPIHYQWLKDGAPLLSATNGLLILSNITRAASGTYAVGVSNAGGGVVSSNAFLQVMVPQRFHPPLRLGDGRVRLIFGDQDGFALRASDATNFFLYASPGLGRQAAWRPVTNSLVWTNGMFMVEDSQAIGAARRFYLVIDGDRLGYIDDPTNPNDITAPNPNPTVSGN